MCTSVSENCIYHTKQCRPWWNPDDQTTLLEVSSIQRVYSPFSDEFNQVMPLMPVQWVKCLGLFRENIDFEWSYASLYVYKPVILRWATQDPRALLFVIWGPFSKWTFSKSSFRNTIRVSNCLHPDFVGPDLGPNCLQRIWLDDTSRQR